MTFLKTAKSKISPYFLTILGFGGSFLFLLPLYYAIIASLSSSGAVGEPSLFFTEFHYQNYIEIWREIPLLTYLFNGVTYSLVATFIALAAAIPAAYSIVRFKFTGNRIILIIILITQTFTVAMIIVPLFLLWLNLGLFDTRTAVTITMAGLCTPLAIWMLRGFFENIPFQLEEQAMIDGCNRIQAFIKVILPVASPGIVTTIVVTFTLAYKQFFIPLVLLSSSSKYPALVGIYTFSSRRMPPWHLVMTSTIITMLPVVVLFLLLRKYVIGGLAAGALKM